MRTSAGVSVSLAPAITGSNSCNAEHAATAGGGPAPGVGRFPGLGVSQWAYASLSLGSALPLFMSPHSVTAVLSTKNRNIIRRNAALLPAYSFLLGLLALGRKLAH